MPFFLKLAKPDFKFLSDQLARLFGAVAQNFGDAEEAGFVVLNDTGIRRDADFAIGKGVERLQGLVGVDPGGQEDADLDMLGGAVLDFGDAHFALVDRFEHRIDEARGCRAEGDLADDEFFGFPLFDAGAHLDAASAESVIVVGDICDAALREIGKEFEGLLLQHRNAGVDELVKIVRQDFAGETDGDALGSVGEDKGELCRQGHGFLVAAVVAGRPGRGLGIEKDLVGEFGEARLDVSRCGGGVTGENITPVPLSLDDEFLLPHVDERVTDGLVAVGVILHRVADDVGHFVETTVVFFLQRMEDAPLHGLQSIIDVRDGTFKDDVAGVFQKPFGIHAFQR